ncbi:uncharacterized protein LOC142318136 [Lycorma delicatula]|uniref:uncharacterized protein LOC142318136 n=1 Tax=Lycorma delicatula TaxID=130591 RepID=UPI003F50DDA4
MVSPVVIQAIINNVIRLRWDLSDSEEMYLLSALLRYQKNILNCLKEEGRRFDGNIKWYVAANVELMKRTQLEDGVETTYTNLYLHGKTRTVINLDDNTDVVEESWIESVEKIIDTDQIHQQRQRMGNE